MSSCHCEAYVVGRGNLTSKRPRLLRFARNDVHQLACDRPLPYRLAAGTVRSAVFYYPIFLTAENAEVAEKFSDTCACVTDRCRQDLQDERGY
ncbi:MAG: hypothetical protein ACE5NM_07645 [Sedimentisphaerales bacterium]